MRENLCYKSKHLEKNNKGLSQLIVREKIFYNHCLQNQMDRMKIRVHTHKDEYFHVFHVFFLHLFLPHYIYLTTLVTTYFADWI